MTDSLFDFPVSIKRSQRKTAAIHITDEGVEVRLPYGVKDDFAWSFVREKSDWIQRKRQLQQERRSHIPELDIGQSILWLGQEVTLTYQAASRWHGFIQDAVIVIEGPELPTPLQIRAVLEFVYKRQAKRMLPSLTAHVAKRIGATDRLNYVKFRRTKSKWGHCTHDGVIQFNWLIMGAPESVIYYLVCHEACHLIHHNHSAAFWSLVKLVCPTVDESERWLKDYGLKLDWFHSKGC